MLCVVGNAFLRAALSRSVCVVYSIGRSVRLIRFIVARVGTSQSKAQENKYDESEIFHFVYCFTEIISKSKKKSLQPTAECRLRRELKQFQSDYLESK